MLGREDLISGIAEEDKGETKKELDDVTEVVLEPTE